MREYGQISAKTLGKMRKNTHEGVQPKNFKLPLLRRFFYSLLFKANGAHVMLGGHKKILKIRYAPLHTKRKQAQNYAYSEDN